MFAWLRQNKESSETPTEDIENSREEDFITREINNLEGTVEEQKKEIRSDTEKLKRIITKVNRTSNKKVAEDNSPNSKDISEIRLFDSDTKYTVTQFRNIEGRLRREIKDIIKCISLLRKLIENESKGILHDIETPVKIFEEFVNTVRGNNIVEKSFELELILQRFEKNYQAMLDLLSEFIENEKEYDESKLDEDWNITLYLSRKNKIRRELNGKILYLRKSIEELKEHIEKTTEETEERRKKQENFSIKLLKTLESSLEVIQERIRISNIIILKSIQEQKRLHKILDRLKLEIKELYDSFLEIQREIQGSKTEDARKRIEVFEGYREEVENELQRLEKEIVEAEVLDENTIVEEIEEEKAKFVKSRNFLKLTLTSAIISLGVIMAPSQTNEGVDHSRGSQPVEIVNAEPNAKKGDLENQQRSERIVSRTTQPGILETENEERISEVKNERIVSRTTQPGILETENEERVSEVVQEPEKVIDVQSVGETIFDNILPKVDSIIKANSEVLFDKKKGDVELYITEKVLPPSVEKLINDIKSRSEVEFPNRAQLETIGKNIYLDHNNLIKASVRSIDFTKTQETDRAVIGLIEGELYTNEDIRKLEPNINQTTLDEIRGNVGERLTLHIRTQSNAKLQEVWEKLKEQNYGESQLRMLSENLKRAVDQIESEIQNTTVDDREILAKIISEIDKIIESKVPAVREQLRREIKEALDIKFQIDPEFIKGTIIKRTTSVEAAIPSKGDLEDQGELLSLEFERSVNTWLENLDKNRTTDRDIRILSPEKSEIPDFRTEISKRANGNTQIIGKLTNSVEAKLSKYIFEKASIERGKIWDKLELEEIRKEILLGYKTKLAEIINLLDKELEIERDKGDLSDISSKANVSLEFKTGIEIETTVKPFSLENLKLPNSLDHFETNENGFISIIFFGFDHSGRRADTIMQYLINPKTGHTMIVSIPRDIAVRDNDKGTIHKLNGLIPRPFDKEGLGKTIKIVEDITGQKVSYMTSINLNDLQTLFSPIFKNHAPNGIDITFEDEYNIGGKTYKGTLNINNSIELENIVRARGHGNKDYVIRKGTTVKIPLSRLGDKERRNRQLQILSSIIDNNPLITASVLTDAAFKDFVIGVNGTSNPRQISIVLFAKKFPKVGGTIQTFSVDHEEEFRIPQAWAPEKTHKALYVDPNKVRVKIAEFFYYDPQSEKLSRSTVDEYRDKKIGVGEGEMASLTIEINIDEAITLMKLDKLPDKFQNRIIKVKGSRKPTLRPKPIKKHFVAFHGTGYDQDLNKGGRVGKDISGFHQLYRSADTAYYITSTGAIFQFFEPSTGQGGLGRVSTQNIPISIGDNRNLNDRTIGVELALNVIKGDKYPIGVEKPSKEQIKSGQFLFNYLKTTLGVVGFSSADPVRDEDGQFIRGAHVDDFDDDVREIIGLMSKSKAKTLIRMLKQSLKSKSLHPELRKIMGENYPIGDYNVEKGKVPG